uniref:Uncharacterized protein n=1 Tax=Molossus molossus TaxID=27622 RepID=A0A7J8BL16_MOLMO|nr:hypothetical protein HJG59_010214 [Molossus molossus]
MKLEKMPSGLGREESLARLPSWQEPLQPCPAASPVWSKRAEVSAPPHGHGNQGPRGPRPLPRLRRRQRTRHRQASWERQGLRWPRGRGGRGESTQPHASLLAIHGAPIPCGHLRYLVSLDQGGPPLPIL